MSSKISSRQIAFQLLQQAYEQFEKKEFEAALQSCQAALTIYQAIGDMAGVGYTLSNIANVYREQAREFYSQALSTFEDNNVQIDDPSIAQSLTDPLQSQPGWYASNDKTRVVETDNGDPDRIIVRLKSRPPSVKPPSVKPPRGFTGVKPSDNGDLDNGDPVEVDNGDPD